MRVSCDLSLKKELVLQTTDGKSCQPKNVGWVFNGEPDKMKKKTQKKKTGAFFLIYRL